jgi:hypothetical protein
MFLLKKIKPSKSTYNQLSPEVADHARGDHRDKAGNHKAVVQEILTDPGGSGTVKVYYGNIA